MLLTSLFLSDTQFSDTIVYQPLPSARLPPVSPSPFYHKSHILITHFPKKAEASVSFTKAPLYSLVSRAEIMCVLRVCSYCIYLV
uniref:Uncharacterized protein n=1 Tax=Anguilla anguilla TaxID=7936 RepID=A0A0E9WQ07_ANGAN